MREVKPKDIEVLLPNKEIIQNPNFQLKPEEEKKGVVSELEKQALIKSLWWVDSYLAVKLLQIIEEAEAPDNKWQLHIDYRTRLRGLESILKLTNKDFDNSWIHLNFFASPKKLKH